MFASPDTLEDLCLVTICENILSYIEPQIDYKDSWHERIDSSDSSFEEEVERYRFRDPDIFIINEISEKLLEHLSEKRLLHDATLNIFTGRNTKLRKFRIRNSRITKLGLQVLKQHNITELECIDLKRVSIGDILDCLNEWSVENMLSANFARCTFISESRFSFMVKITNLKNLRSLNLAYTELNQTMFKIICEDLIHLEKLDISGTYITSLKPLTMLSSKLTSLFICDLHGAEHLVSTLDQLQLLQYLDVSFLNEKIDNQMFNVNSSPLLEVLENPYALPDLEMLDISGWKEFIPRHALLKFIDTHPRLQFLGIVMCSLSFDPLFSDSSGMDRPKNLVISGLGNEEQIKLTLKKYKDRSSYIQKALYHLFQLTSTFQKARPDIFQLVLQVMEVHSSKFGVQMAATACLYNLTRGELSKSIHPMILSKGVNLTLYAMEKFPEEFQLQKNSLLTLCSDRILQDVYFDRFRCAELVLNALCQFEDVNMDRMAVAICSILAAKVSTEETSRLGARPKFMRKLLAMVQSRVDSKTADITLKFTLSALWNLTDESSATCKVFLELEGAQLFLEVLKVFKDNLAIETKVLGLLNNIAEVGELRNCLMIETLVNELFILLKSDNIDVSYFAAGIVAHLACDGETCWRIVDHPRAEMLEELERAVSSWKVPNSEMVAYRSFKPFFSLLKTHMDYQVQLWAVWAIHHVCTKNPKRYCMMLNEEKGHVLLRDLFSHEGTHHHIRDICSTILNTLDSSV